MACVPWAPTFGSGRLLASSVTHGHGGPEVGAPTSLLPASFRPNELRPDGRASATTGCDSFKGDNGLLRLGLISQQQSQTRGGRGVSLCNELDWRESARSKISCAVFVGTLFPVQTKRKIPRTPGSVFTQQGLVPTHTGHGRPHGRTSAGTALPLPARHWGGLAAFLARPAGGELRLPYLPFGNDAGD